MCRLAALSRPFRHEVKTAGQMGWTAIGNGELLALASQELDMFVTVDRNLAFQQNFGVLTIAVVVLQGPSNRLADLNRLVPHLLAVLGSAAPGQLITVAEPSL